MCKWIKGFEGLYQIDEEGNIYSFQYKQKRKLKPYDNFNGYLKVSLKDKDHKLHRRFVHRLVAETFIENPCSLKYTDVDHIDGNRYNNNVYNLQWVTHKQNIRYVYERKRK